jgi:hypothetical protein
MNFGPQDYLVSTFIAEQEATSRSVLNVGYAPVEPMPPETRFATIEGELTGNLLSQ